MDATDFAAGEWLKAKDIEGKPHPTFEISEVTTGRYDDADKDHLVLVFTNHQKFGLNQTNTTKLMTLFGSETDNWPGNTLEAYVEGTPKGDGVRFRAATGDKSAPF